jgi:hypothetical protein
VSSVSLSPVDSSSGGCSSCVDFHHCPLHFPWRRGETKDFECSKCQTLSWYRGQQQHPIPPAPDPVMVVRDLNVAAAVGVVDRFSDNARGENDSTTGETDDPSQDEGMFMLGWTRTTLLSPSVCVLTCMGVRHACTRPQHSSCNGTWC